MHIIIPLTSLYSSDCKTRSRITLILWLLWLCLNLRFILLLTKMCTLCEKSKCIWINIKKVTFVSGGWHSPKLTWTFFQYDLFGSTIQIMSICQMHKIQEDLLNLKVNHMQQVLHVILLWFSAQLHQILLLAFWWETKTVSHKPFIYWLWDQFSWCQLFITILSNWFSNVENIFLQQHCDDNQISPYLKGTIAYISMHSEFYPII